MSTKIIQIINLLSPFGEDIFLEKSLQTLSQILVQLIALHFEYTSYI
jgi:hypothetical protein